MSVNRTGNAPIERKVTAATGTAAVTGFILWLLARFVFDGDQVPEAVIGLILWLVPAIGAFVGGYLARHTARPDIGQP